MIVTDNRLYSNALNSSVI